MDGKHKMSENAHHIDLFTWTWVPKCTRTCMCRQLISCNAAVVGVADVSQLHSFVSAFVSPFARFLFFRLPCEFTAVYTLDCCHTFMTSVAATGGQRRAASVVIKCATCLQHTCRQHCTRTHAESKERSQVI